MGKLTEPQRVLLAELHERSHPVHWRYPPAVKLVALSLARWEDVHMSEILHITDAGRQALTGEPG